MNPIETNNKEECVYHLPCMSPFQNVCPMTPLENIIQGTIHTIENLSESKIYDIITYILNKSSFELISNIFYCILSNSNSEFLLNIRDFCDNLLSSHVVDHIDEQHENFKSISIEIEQVKVNSKEVESKEVESKEVESKEVESEEDDTEEDDTEEDDAEEVKPEEVKPEEVKIEEVKPVKVEPIKVESIKVKHVKEIFIGTISHIKDKKATITLPDGTKGFFPDKFNYYGNEGDKVSVSIKFEDKFKKIIILNFIETHFIHPQFKIGDKVNGFIQNGKDKKNNSVIFVNVYGIQGATLPKTYINNELKNGMNVSCTIYNTYDYTNADNNVIGIGAVLTFNDFNPSN